MINAIGVGESMWVYAGFNVLAWLFIWRRMPELSGRSLEQIEGQLRKHRFSPADFARAHMRRRATRTAAASGD
jgi:hypothetical protein